MATFFDRFTRLLIIAVFCAILVALIAEGVRHSGLGASTIADNNLAIVELYNKLNVGISESELYKILDGIPSRLRVDRFPEQRVIVVVPSSSVDMFAVSRVLRIELSDTNTVKKVSIRATDSPSRRFDSDPPDKIMGDASRR